MEGHTDLNMLANSTLTAVRYQDENIRAIVRPYAGAVGLGFLLVYDNAPLYLAKVCRFLDDEGTDRPSCFPDLNTIKNLHVAPQNV